ncbi:MAG TPA: BlaI/MecI/CopY family transcriptional regulator [Gemmatimonadota bacterium]|nr:BlaI/MecI/CopY family transcriptional regulator [Gemmatimonadota bacterium]
MSLDAAIPELTRSELAVLKVLWKEGECSAREVHQRVESVTGWAYSTTRTTLDRMAGKGLLARRRFHGMYLYVAAVTRAAGLAGVVRELAERVLETDYAPVVSLFAEANALTPEEVAELERLLEEEVER